MRVVLDTNILISALLRPTSVPALLVQAWIEKRFVLVSHPIQMDEFRAVTRRPKIQARIKPAQAGSLANRLLSVAEHPLELPRVERSPDPHDDFLLSVCEAGNVDRLVTGDKDDLLALNKHRGTRIVTAIGLASELGICD